MVKTSVKPEPLKIGDLVLDMPVALAPMAGFTDTAWRSVCCRHHCGFVFTEVINAAAIVRRIPRTMQLLETSEDERPVAAHIYGNDPEVMGEAASVIESLQRFDIIDLNCGCPVRKIVAAGSGAALIRSPERIGQIVSAMKSAVSLPVTVKTRIGFEPDNMNIRDIVHAVQEAGGDAICIHARFAVNKHGGKADWDALGMAKAVSSIPVIGNGGIQVAGDVPAMLSATHVDGVMVGRAALGNPWLFDEIDCLFRGRPHEPHGIAEHRKTVMEHLERLVGSCKKERKTRRRARRSPEQVAGCRFRGHLCRYFAGFKGFSEIRRNLDKLRTVEDVVNVIDRVIALNPVNPVKRTVTGL